MFTKSAADITFSDIEDFCREFGENVRVEYKREIRHIAKIVSSFANTSGGIFIIGVETDQDNKVKLPIQGILKRSGIEEQIQQSALTGIYPAVIPEVIIQNVPDTENVVVIVRVDESPQAPHAIQNSTRVYVRTGSITQPYDEPQLSEIDKIEYMLKRREDSQTISRQILGRIEERIKSLFDTNEPNLTAITRPVFPHRPIIATADIYDFASKNELVWSDYSSRVAGGFFVSTIRDNDSNFALRNSYVCWELNEYGIVYHRVKLEKRTSTFAHGETEEHLDFRQFVSTIGELIQKAQFFYEKCEYLGNVEITVKLRKVLVKNLGFTTCIIDLPRKI